MNIKVTTVVLVPPFAPNSLTMADACEASRLASTVERYAPLCDESGLVESGEGSACSRDLLCMCDACVASDVATVAAVARGTSSARLPRVSERMGVMVREGASTVGLVVTLAATLATGLAVGAIFGQMMATL